MKAKKKKQLTAIDLFAGLGGFTEGAEKAGLKVIWAANHWQAAVQVHANNHPITKHACQDLRQADFTQLPDFDVLLASPCCQGHSKARGKDRPHHDTARATAYAVFEAACAKEPDYIIVENVTDFRTWGTKDRKGIFYSRWLANFDDLGYNIEENVLDAATVGVPQNRVRLFITMVHKRLRKEGVRVLPGTAAEVPARDIIDWNNKDFSPIHTANRSPNTLRQIERGRLYHGKKFLIAYYGNSGPGRSLDRPLGTVTTKDRYALIEGRWMRMLTKEEYLRAQAFPTNYFIPDDHEEAVKMIGNAVPPPMATHVINTVLAA